MVKRILFIFLLAIIACVPVHAQTDTVTKATTPQLVHKHLRISLIICSEGNESWESFGHSCLRVIDTDRHDVYGDREYNYGTFDFFDGSFIYKFLKGKMTSFLEIAPFGPFIKTYADEGRGVTEQVLLLTPEQKDRMIAFLDSNGLIENKYYDYDLIYDNCSTRIRDMLIHTLGNSLVMGQVVPKNSSTSIREICEEYCANKHWLRLGLEIFASNTDKKAGNLEAIFVPSYLEQAISKATVDGHKLAADKTTIYQDKLQKHTVNEPFIYFLIISLLTIIGLSVKQFAVLGKVMSNFVLFATGILGCCMLYTWFGSTHEAFRNNFNLLWALPTNMIIPFLSQKIKAKYALVAICLLVLSLFIDLLRIQVMPLSEIASIWVALLYIYFMMYKKK